MRGRGRDLGQHGRGICHSASCSKRVHSSSIAAMRSGREAVSICLSPTARRRSATLFLAITGPKSADAHYKAGGGPSRARRGALFSSGRRLGGRGRGRGSGRPARIARVGGAITVRSHRRSVLKRGGRVSAVKATSVMPPAPRRSTAKDCRKEVTIAGRTARSGGVREIN